MYIYICIYIYCDLIDNLTKLIRPLSVYFVLFPHRYVVSRRNLEGQAVADVLTPVMYIHYSHKRSRHDAYISLFGKVRPRSQQCK